MANYTFLNKHTTLIKGPFILFPPDGNLMTYISAQQDANGFLTTDLITLIFCFLTHSMDLYPQLSTSSAKNRISNIC